MFERFTDRARKVMALANQEAQRFNHEYIGIEHILLGLVKEGSGVGANVLRNLDVDVKKLRLEIEKLVKCGPDKVTWGRLPQTPRAKGVIKYAIEEARSFNHNYIGSEHILLGLLRETEGIAAQVLMNLGLKLENVREEVLNLLGTGTKDSNMAMVEIKKRYVPDSQMTAMAGQFLVAGKLFKRQLQVSVTLGNAKEIDIFAQNPDTNRTFCIRVITVQLTDSFPLSQESILPEHIYVFVLLNSRDEDDEYFIIPGKTILENIDDFYTSYYPSTLNKRPVIDYDSLKEYKDNWKVFGTESKDLTE